MASFVGKRARSVRLERFEGGGQCSEDPGAEGLCLVSPGNEREPT